MNRLPFGGMKGEIVRVRGRPARRLAGVWPGLAFLVVFFLGAAGGNAHGGTTRLAVIGSPGLEKESLLLTAALSANADLEILERAEIAKVLQEQRLERQGLTARDGVRVGALLKADGLVLLEQAAAEIRLWVVAVDSGAMAGFSSTPSRLEQADEWSALRAAEIARLAPKLKLPGSEAVPISLMQINSASGGERAAVLEETVYSLLAARLSAEPKAIVLERARLQEAVAEKEFGAENGAFWNSAWVIDGTFTENPSGFSLDLRLQSPGSDERRLKADAPDLAGLVEKANGEILRILGQPGRPWDRAGEARRYGDEALWAAGNGLWGQAARAIEAAVALGESSPEALRWRWQCYNRLARNLPGTKRAGQFVNAAGMDRPGAAQIRQMARSLQLYQEALVGKKIPLAAEKENSLHEPLRARRTGPRPGIKGFSPGYSHRAAKLSRFGELPPTFDGQEQGGGPDEEGRSLLEAATLLILAVEKPKTPVESPEREALRELRGQIHELFDAMATSLPGMALTSGRDARVPDWNPDADPRSPTGRRDRVAPENLYTARLRQGRAWEESPEPYFAFVRQCLVSDFPGDPNFYQTVLRVTGTRRPMRGDVWRSAYDKEWRVAAEAMVSEKNLRLQVAGAFMLCRARAPVRGLGVFERHKELMLDRSLPVDWAAQAFAMDPGFQAGQENPQGESLSKATGIFKDLIVFLLDHDRALSPDVLYKLAACWFTERQAGELLAALRRYEARHPSLPSSSGAMANVTRELSRRARETVEKEPVSPVVQNTPPPVPVAPPETRPKPSSPLSIEHAWVARNYNDPNAPGMICHALFAADKIWLHVESPGSRPGPVSRKFVALDLPSLKSRTLHRDTVPEAAKPSGLFRAGPTFASDGAAIYFWDGRGIRCVRDKESRLLEVPELKKPFLWLVDGFLYAVDEEGVLLRVDPASGRYEILASSRRRPPQNALDAEPGLHEIRRIFRGPDGALTVSMAGQKAYLQREAGSNWELLPPGKRGGEAQLLAELDDAWDLAGGSLARQMAEALIRERNPPEPGRGLRNLSPAMRYLPAADQAAHRRGAINAQTGVISNSVFWSLLEDWDHQCWLLKLDLPSGRFVCRAIVFSPEPQAYVELAGRTNSEARLIPTPRGTAIYSPGQPVLWFVPETEFDPSVPHSIPPVIP